MIGSHEVELSVSMAFDNDIQIEHTIYEQGDTIEVQLGGRRGVLVTFTDTGLRRLHEAFDAMVREVEEMATADAPSG